MADPQTFNTGLFVPTRGSDVGTWDTPVNADFSAIDGFFGGVQTVSAAGSSPITLTSPAGFTPVPSAGPTQSQNGVIRFSGALTGNVQITLPLPGYAIIENLTTGAFVLSFRAIGSGQVVAIQQGSCRHVYNDGTNVRFVNLPDVGTYLDLAASSVPAWISACTIPPYLNCDGTTFSAATYPYLNSFLGGNTLPDYRGRAGYYLNQTTGRLTSTGCGLDGNTLFSAGGNDGLLLTALQIPSLTSSGNNNITVTLGTLVQLDTAGSINVASGGAGSVPVSNSGQPNSAGVNNITVTYTNPGGSPNPVHNAAPGIVGGIRLIRAA